jgi:phage FluMu protein Com
MPIRFRCGYCNKLLAIATRKAGVHTACPHCGATIAVPGPDDHAAPDEAKPELAEIDQLLKADRASNGSARNPAAVADPVSAEGFSTTPAAPSSTATPAPTVGLTPKPTRKPASPPTEVLPLPEEEKPLFEHGVDAALGNKDAAREPKREQKSRPAAIPVPEVMPLGDELPSGYHLTPAKMTALVVGGVVLLVLAFTAGFFVGAR